MANPNRKLNRIRVLMLFSQALLVCFMVYWLRSEYFGEQRVLKKDLIVQLAHSQDQISDSLITVTILDPIMKDMPGAPIPGRHTGLSDTTPGMSERAALPPLPRKHDGKKIISHFTEKHSQNGKADSVIMFTMRSPDMKDLQGSPMPGGLINLRDTIREMSIRPSLSPLLPEHGVQKITAKEQTFILRPAHSADPAPNHKADPTLTRRVRLLINETNNRQVGPTTVLMHTDTLLLRKGFQNAISKSGYTLGSRWVAASSEKSEHRFLLNSPDIPAYNLEILFYGRYLVRKIIPQFLITIVLLSLTAVAFLVTYKALRAQTHLAAIRNDFISNMSHELKTPVSTVKVALEALNEPEVLQDISTTRDYLRMATLELARLELLINQTLQTSLLEEGRMALQTEPVNLGTLVDELIQTMQPRFLQQGATVETTVAGNDFTVPADRLQVQGVVVNILDNALKYAGPAPVIKLLINETPDGVRIAVSDNGPGIPAAYINRIFDKFFRVPRGNVHSVKGYGLGLSYAAQVMKMHGGSIAMQPSPEGGCNFLLHFKRSIA